MTLAEDRIWLSQQGVTEEKVHFSVLYTSKPTTTSFPKVERPRYRPFIQELMKHKRITNWSFKIFGVSLFLLLINSIVEMQGVSVHSKLSGAAAAVHWVTKG